MVLRLGVITIRSLGTFCAPLPQVGAGLKFNHSVPGVYVLFNSIKIKIMKIYGGFIKISPNFLR